MSISNTGSTPNQALQALLKAQAEFPTIEKNKKGVHGTMYADLSEVFSKTKPILNKYGLFVTQEILDYQIITSFWHVASGDVFTSKLPFIYPDDIKIQQMAANITYLRRYGFCTAVGVIADEDTEGATESGSVTHTTHSRADKTPSSSGAALVSLDHKALTTALAKNREAYEQKTVADARAFFENDPGERVITDNKGRVGKKFGTKKYNEVPMSELIGYRRYLEKPDEKNPNAPMSREAQMFIQELEDYQAFMKAEADKKMPGYDKGYKHPEEYNGPPIEEQNLPF